MGDKPAPSQISLPMGDPKVEVTEEKPILQYSRFTHIHNLLCTLPFFLLYDLVAIKLCSVQSGCFKVLCLATDQSSQKKNVCRSYTKPCTTSHCSLEEEGRIL